VSDTIQRWASIVASVVVLGGVGFLTSEQLGKPRPRAAAGDAGAGATASASASASSAASSSAAAEVDGGSPEISLDGGFSLGLLDGGLGLGSMPSSAPRSVRLGIVLVQFAGAEGASSTARSKPDALKHAQTLAEQGRTDFKAAVKAGDSGSSEDTGRFVRGFLSGAPTEIAIFSLGVGDVSEPLETSRGYWVAKRIE